MSDWRIPGDPTPDDSVPTEPDDWSSAADAAPDPFADSAFADSTDPFSAEIADVDASDWDADLLWGPDTPADGGDDLPF
ncbi:hypothetical protein ACLBXX_16495 [Microbacterium sp. C23T]